MTDDRDTLDDRRTDDETETGTGTETGSDRRDAPADAVEGSERPGETAGTTEAARTTEAVATADDGDGGAEDRNAGAAGGGMNAERLRGYFDRAVLAGLFLFALVAAFRFYFAASNAVAYWVGDAYESTFQAAFNLVVLLVVGAGIAYQLRRMR